MFFSQESLKDRLYQYSHDDLITLITKLYARHPEVQSDINQFAVTRDDADSVLNHMEKYSPGECKTALMTHIKTIKDRKSKVLYYFSFVESILDRKDQLDFRFLAVASAAYGKAMDVLEKDKMLWDEMLDRSYEIAGRFYEIDGVHAGKAVEYYVKVKRGFDSQQQP